MAKSYFMILGISPEATTNEIKSAYRRLVKEFHPDHYTGGNDAFREIQEAYSVLGDTRRRREYEQQISKRPRMRSMRPTFRSEPEPRNGTIAGSLKNKLFSDPVFYLSISFFKNLLCFAIL